MSFISNIKISAIKFIKYHYYKINIQSYKNR